MSVCVHHFNHLSATQGGLLAKCPFHSYSFLSYFRQYTIKEMHNSHHMCNGWSSIDDQPSTLINKLHILHVTRTEEWAQPDWIAASVSLIPPEELWDQVLINGTEDTSSLLWRSSISVCMKHCFDTATQQNHIPNKILQNPTHWPKNCSSTTRCYSFQTCFRQPQVHLFSGLVSTLITINFPKILWNDK